MFEQNMNYVLQTFNYETTFFSKLNFFSRILLLKQSFHMYCSYWAYT